MRRSTLLLVLLLLACGRGEGPAAEERYHMVERNHGTLADLCTASKDVAAGYLRDGDEKAYNYWHGMSQGQCIQAGFENS